MGSGDGGFELEGFWVIFLNVLIREVVVYIGMVCSFGFVGKMGLVFDLEWFCVLVGDEVIGFMFFDFFFG